MFGEEIQMPFLKKKKIDISGRKKYRFFPEVAS